MKRDNRICVIIPLYNEHEVFQSLINRLEKVIDECSFEIEVILIDDGNTDKTKELIKEVFKSNLQYMALILAKIMDISWLLLLE